ncbi:MAG: TIGR04086 family membrane protein [Gorillibacterium sp.]|nr:TIGR04086 family membrane protein [Gorillibacterium sp.]
MNMQRSEKAPIAAPILGGMIWAFGMMAAGALIFSLLLAFTDQKESSLPSATYVIHALSALIGGMVAGKKSGARGWYAGGATGILYAVLLYLIGFLGFDRGLQLQSLLLVAAAFAIGALGGIIGVNTKK